MEQLQATLNRILEQADCFDDTDLIEIRQKASQFIQAEDINGLRKYIKHLSRVVAEQSMFDKLLQTPNDDTLKPSFSDLFSLNAGSTTSLVPVPEQASTQAEITQSVPEVEYERDIYAELEAQEEEEAFLEEDDSEGFDDTFDEEAENVEEVDDYFEDDSEGFEEEYDTSEDDETDQYDLEDDGFEEDDGQAEFDEEALLDSIDDGFEEDEPLLDNIDVDYEDEEALLDSMAFEEDDDDYMSEDEMLLAQMDDSEDDGFDSSDPDDYLEDYYDDAEFGDDGFDDYEEDPQELTEDELLDSMAFEEDEEEPLLDNIDVDYGDEESLLDSMSDDGFDDEYEEESEYLDDGFEDDGFEDSDDILDQFDSDTEDEYIEDDGFEDDGFEDTLGDAEETDGLDDYLFEDDGFDDEEPSDSFENQKTSVGKPAGTSKPIAFGGGAAAQLPDLGLTPSHKPSSSNNANLGQNKNPKGQNSPDAIFKDRRANSLLKLLGLK